MNENFLPKFKQTVNVNGKSYEAVIIKCIVAENKIYIDENGFYYEIFNNKGKWEIMTNDMILIKGRLLAAAEWYKKP